MPIPSATLNATPLLLHVGDFTTVSWTSQNTTSCTVHGTNGDSWAGLTSGALGKTSSTIDQQTIFTLSCTALDGSLVRETATVNVIPVFQEL